jgi:hypothetical protein
MIATSEFVLAVRQHNEAYVRRACVFAATHVVSVLSAAQLVTASLLPLVDACRKWMQTVASGDADDDTRIMAAGFVYTLREKATLLASV